MSTVSVALFKQHMGITDALEDELIEVYIGASDEWIGNYIGRPLRTFDPVPADLKLAVLKLTAFHYEQREAVGFGEAMRIAPFGVTAIADNYRPYLGLKHEDVFGKPAPQDVDDDF